MDSIYENIEEYIPNKKRKILIVFDVIANIFDNKKHSPVVTELFIKGRKLNIFLIITQSYFALAKIIGLNFKNGSFNKLHLIIPDIDFRDLVNLYKTYTAKPCF